MYACTVEWQFLYNFCHLVPREGIIDTPTESDEPELPYRGILSEDGRTPGRESYGEIVTANTLCHQFRI